MCRVIVELGGFRLAAVGYAGHDDEKSIRWMTSVGADLDFLRAQRLAWADHGTGMGNGTLATAIRSGRPSVARNLLTDPGYAGPEYAWQEAGLERVLAVNLSAHDLYDPGSIDRIGGMYSTWGIAPGRIEFELTESGLMEDPAAALATLRRLKEFDVELYIDDYGTGYSSLSYPQKLPVDALKIDQSFVLPLRRDSAPAQPRSCGGQ